MAGSLMLTLYSFFMKRIQSITPSMDWPPTSRNHAIPQTTFSVRSYYFHCLSCLLCESITWMETVKKRIINYWPFLSSLFAFLFFLPFRLRCGACSVCPPIWILWAWLHHRVLPDTSSHQLGGTANAEDRERIPRGHPAGHAPQPTAGGLLLRQARGGVPWQHVCRASEQRWGVKKKNPKKLRTELCLWLQSVS